MYMNVVSVFGKWTQNWATPTCVFPVVHQTHQTQCGKGCADFPSLPFSIFFFFHNLFFANFL